MFDNGPSGRLCVRWCRKIHTPSREVTVNSELACRAFIYYGRVSSGASRCDGFRMVSSRLRTMSGITTSSGKASYGAPRKTLETHVGVPSEVWARRAHGFGREGCCGGGECVVDSWAVEGLGPVASSWGYIAVYIGRRPRTATRWVHNMYCVHALELLVTCILRACTQDQLHERIFIGPVYHMYR